MNYKVTKKEWENVLKVMDQYKRPAGFVDIIDGKLTFLDGNAKVNGSDSLYITRPEVILYISIWKE